MAFNEKNGGTSKAKAAIIRFDKILTTIETNIGIVFYACMIIMVLYGVFMRFVLRAPNLYGEELSMLLMFGSVCLGINLGIRSRSHLGVEGFINHLPAGAKKVVKILTDIVIIAVYALMAVVTFQLYAQSKVHGATTAALQMPFWIIYLIMAINFILCDVQALLLFWNDYLIKEPVLSEQGGGMVE